MSATRTGVSPPKNDRATAPGRVKVARDARHIGAENSTHPAKRLTRKAPLDVAKSLRDWNEFGKRSGKKARAR
jgi:hypothetical protein